MAYSYRLFRIFGISVELHITFILFLILVLFFGFPALLFFLLLFAIVLVHEFCHSLVAMSFGIKVPKITLLPIGGLASVELPSNPVQELAISIAGPLFNFAMALAAFVLLVLLKVSMFSYNSVLDAFMSGSAAQSPLTLALNLIIYINLVLGGLNALPAFPMDGGRIFRSALALWLDYLTATRIALWFGQLFFLFMVIAGFLLGNFWWVIVGVFLSFAGSSELKYITVRNIFEGVNLGDIAVRDVKMVSESVIVKDFMSLIASKNTRFYFIVDLEGNVKGILDLNLLQARNFDPKDPVSRHSARSIIIAGSKVSVEEALKGLMSEEIVVVVDDGRLVGYVTQDSVELSMGYYSAVKKMK